MTTAAEVIKKAQATTMWLAVTGGENVESRRALVRKATPVEENGYCVKKLYVIDRCPGCGDTVPVVVIRFPTASYIIAEHTIMICEGEEAVCGYGGEPLKFLTTFPT